MAVVTSLCLATGIVALSNLCDKAVVGSGGACIVALGTLSSLLLPKALAIISNHTDIFMQEINWVANLMSDFCFHLLFAAIGSSANLGEAVRQGGWHSASSFLFVALAQVVHLAVLLGGSLGVAKLFPNFKLFPLGIDEIMVASNAAIGGPVTAAAFAGKEAPKRRGLVVAATVWGVVGYAVGTRIGVRLTRALLHIVES